MTTFRELLVEQLSDIQNAETQITQALPELVAAASDPDLKIWAYGTAIAWAKQLDLDVVVDLLDESLDEESDADEKLTRSPKAACWKPV